jgi:uncharacterized membrane protein YgdD (TMEM256/DUF423 family)
MTHSIPWSSVSALLGATSVMVGAFAAHGLENQIDEKSLEWLQTGAYYQMSHALALMGWGNWRNGFQSSGHSASPLPGIGFTLGTLIFSGTLYAMALGAPRWLGAITPIGGTLLILAWFGFAIQAFTK